MVCLASITATGSARAPFLSRVFSSSSLALILLAPMNFTSSILGFSREQRKMRMMPLRFLSSIWKTRTFSNMRVASSRFRSPSTVAFSYARPSRLWRCRRTFSTGMAWSPSKRISTILGALVIDGGAGVAGGDEQRQQGEDGDSRGGGESEWGWAPGAGGRARVGRRRLVRRRGCHGGPSLEGLPRPRPHARGTSVSPAGPCMK